MALWEDQRPFQNITVNLTRLTASFLIFHLSLKRSPPTKSEPCSYQQLNSGEDSPKSDDISSSGIIKKQFVKYQVTNKCFSQNLEAAETCLETQKEVVSDDSSDTTSTSTQKMTIDNSDDEMNDSSCPNSSWMSSSSSIPYLGNLFHQESNQSIASINKDVPSPPAIHQEDEQCNKMYMQKMFKENNDDKNSKSSSSTSSSNSSSLLYLEDFFVMVVVSPPIRPSRTSHCHPFLKKKWRTLKAQQMAAVLLDMIIWHLYHLEYFRGGPVYSAIHQVDARTSK
ncbi:hypothetical protein CEXT_585961 [Caerostris extrusa]|uniref:Uncharacterized protein n=1 Tax=Caerostris extrusa TaxID=172846 RepID=A0AAV4VW06_CAEEX|nr:hypothetical protein CEXT_585961 [Caerostris extrusa]